MDEIRDVGGVRVDEKWRGGSSNQKRAVCFWGSVSGRRNPHRVLSAAGQSHVRSPNKKGYWQGGHFSTQCVRMPPLAQVDLAGLAFLLFCLFPHL